MAGEELQMTSRIMAGLLIFSQIRIAHVGIRANRKNANRNCALILEQLFSTYSYRESFNYTVCSPFLVGGTEFYLFDRFDTDSIIPTKINYDLFEYMERNNVKYAYRIRWAESDCCAKKMIKFVYQYVKSHGLENQLSKVIVTIIVYKWLKWDCILLFTV